ncbi:fungal-specific transcription factor domain-containing protein [Mycena sp. CBHHK59/15]|nr:fungal-specific transcription factor domain-containing protein [Mycena sp. CBHHK59/15]
MNETNPPSGSGSAKATSCAECRRLKLRRGCANLCPTGTLEKGKRGFLKRLEQSLPSAHTRGDGETEHSEVAMFVARDNAMSKRIQELEAALAAAGVTIPGLHNNLSPQSETPRESEGRSKRPRTASLSDSLTSQDQLSDKDRSHPGHVDTTDITLGFGTLTIDVENRSRYIGPSGGAAYLNPDLWTASSQTQSRRSSENDISEWQLPGLDAKLRCLPVQREATRLARLYFKNVSFEIIPEEIFFSVHLPAVYPDSMNPRLPANLHVLSLFAMVLALGAFFDLSLPVSNVRSRAAEFYELALASLNISIPLNLDTIPAVQTLNLMALYLLSTGGESGGHPAWQLLGMAMRSIQAQGCHRDGSRWGLSERELEERRRVFWETHTYDRLQSFTFGRPYAQSDSHHPSNSTFSHTRWHHHKFRFAILLGRIVDLAFSVKHPAYSTIMELDSEINEFYAALPAWIICDSVANPIKELPAHAMAGDADLRRHAQIFSSANMVFLTVLHLHRGPFCRALMSGPQNLENSPYAKSIVSLTGAARAIINIARGLFALHPALTSRMWYWIFHSFTAAVCQAVLVIVAPSHSLAPAAFESMQAAVELFERTDGERAKSAAVRVGSLAARASQNMESYRNAVLQQQRPEAVSPTPPKLQFPTSNMRGNPEDLLGTSTKLIRAQPGDDAPQTPPSSVSSASASAPLPTHPTPANLNSRVTTSADRVHDGKYPPTIGEGYWSPSILPSPPAGRSDFNRLPFTHWGTDGSGDQLVNNMQQEHLLDSSGPTYLSVDGFDLSSFIQNGANAWMFDRTPEFRSEEPPPPPPWFQDMQSM